MIDLCRDDRDIHLITRGNVDGIVSTAIFLRRFPLSRVSFVTSPSAAAKALRRDRISKITYVVDLAPTREVVEAIKAKERMDALVVDHHQPPEASEGLDGMVIGSGMSAARVLHEHLGMEDELTDLVAIADLVEFCRSPGLERTLEEHGSKRVFRESKVLDFAWRLNIQDDMFRLRAASRLSNGGWPSEVPMIWSRFMTVQNERRWPKALQVVERRLKKIDNIGILELSGKRSTLYGFGSRALVDVARRKGCHYTMMVHDRDRHASVSLRALRDRSENLGRFVESFTDVHGIGGGGHATSAGARIPKDSTALLLSDLRELVG